MIRECADLISIPYLISFANLKSLVNFQPEFQTITSSRFLLSAMACEQALRGALATGGEKKGVPFSALKGLFMTNCITF